MYQKLWLMFVAAMLPAWVAAQEMAVAKPAETVDVIYVIIFGVIFLGMIAGFFITLWINDRKRKKSGDGQSAA